MCAWMGSWDVHKAKLPHDQCVFFFWGSRHTHHCSATAKMTPMSCEQRVFGDSNNPQQFWSFLELYKWLAVPRHVIPWKSISLGCVCYLSQSKPAMENFAVSAATLRNSANKAVEAHHSFTHLFWMIQQMGLCLPEHFDRSYNELKIHNKILPNNQLVVTNTAHDHFWTKSQTF